jgi:uncharacterized membrane protein
MESLFVLAAVFFVGAPFVLFFLVIGARGRVAELERRVEWLQGEMQLLQGRAASGAAPVAGEEETQEVESPPAMQDESAVVAGPAADFDFDRVIAKSIPESTDQHEPASTDFDAREASVAAARTENARAEADDYPEYAARNEANEANETASAATTDSPRALEMPTAPAWLIAAKEWLFGGNLVAKAGLLILFIGVSFLLKYAAARVTVPIEFRLAGIVLADIGLLLWGWRIRVSRPSISLPVQGGALGILMLVTFGAFRLYEIIPAGLAFGLLFVLTVFTCLLAVLQNALWLAVFGIVGGFAAPILTSTGEGSHVALFSYYALLNAGIVAIALKRSWRLLNLLGYAFTFAISTAWGVMRYEPQNYLSAQAFLILFFVFYVGIAILYASRQAPRLKHYVDGTLVFGTPLLAFGLQYGLVRDMPFGLAFSALALGLFYTGVTLALWSRRGGSLRLLVESFLALGVVFGTLAIPFALDGRWTSAAWALEGAGIVWVGLRQKQTLAWVFGVLVQVGAWLSFAASVSGLGRALAVESNLWLGFLLLAGTGLVMAVNFRRESDRRRGEEEVAGEGEETGEERGSGAVPPIFTILATVFLGFAALWLLAGAWLEILLRDGAHRHTLLVLSAMGVAAVLGLIARRLDWAISGLFALVPQLLAGVVLLWALDPDGVDGLLRLVGRYSGESLADTGFVGGLLIALGAGVSALAFHRQGEGYTHGIRDLPRMLLGWCAFWWFVTVLGSLNDWGASLLANNGWLVEQGYPRVHPLYALLVAAGGIVFAWLARRLQWPDLRALAWAVWPGLLYATWAIWMQLDSPRLHLPSWPAWVAIATLWLVSEWLLRDGEREAWLTTERQPPVLRALHTLRIAGPWLILWPLGYQLVSLALRPDTAEQALMLAEAGWFTAGSWARYLPAWAMMGYVALLVPRARSGRWPTAPIPDWYRQVLIPVGSACSLVLAVLWNFTQNGLMAPLPYLPILNPLDLTTGFAAVLAIVAWRLRAEEGASSPPELLRRGALVAGYVWFNLMLLRTAAHYLDISYQIEPLFDSQFVQAMLSLVWSATALVLMRFAARRTWRTPWMAGAGLLVLVVGKLFFVDLSNVGGIERIVSFLGVGALMLAIGYLAPFPTEKSNVVE